MKRLLFAAVAVSLAFGFSAKGAITLSVGIAPGAPGWENESGVATANMAWGILIHTGSGGFPGTVTTDLATSLLGFNVPTNFTNAASGGPAAAIGTDYAFFIGDDDTSAASGPFNAGGMNEAYLDEGSGGITTGDAVGIIWFPGIDNSGGTLSDGDPFGFQASSTTLPGDGGNVALAGLTPGRASFTVTAAAIPEPSAFLSLLAVFGAICLFSRRRVRLAS